MNIIHIGDDQDPRHHENHNHKDFKPIWDFLNEPWEENLDGHQRSNESDQNCSRWNLVPRWVYLRQRLVTFLGWKKSTCRKPESKQYWEQKSFLYLASCRHLFVALNYKEPVWFFATSWDDLEDLCISNSWTKFLRVWGQGLRRYSRDDCERKCFMDRHLRGLSPSMFLRRTHFRFSWHSN